MDIATNLLNTTELSLEHTMFPWSAQVALKPLEIKSAKGVFFFDSAGKRYLDFSSQHMNVNIGHGHPEIIVAVTKQMEAISYINPSYTTEVRGELGRRLSTLMPSTLSKTMFTLGGSDAVDTAIKVARSFTGRSKIISLKRSYHGTTYAALSASGDPRRFLLNKDSMPDMLRVENPYSYRCPWNSNSAEECAERCAQQIEETICMEGPGSIAAILLEGESGSSGCIKYPPNFWSLIRAICDKYGILIIDDEVMSGFGRTGKMFAVEHFNVEPDIMCMAKGLTSGYIPLGAVAVSKSISDFFNTMPFPTGFTYSSHPVACAAALAVLDVYEKENLLGNATEMGNYLLQELKKLAAKHISIGDIRITGLLGCIELVKNRVTKEPMAPWNARSDQMEIMNRVWALLLDLGLFTVVRWNYVFIAPPLTIRKEEIDEAIMILSRGLQLADKHCN